MPDADRLPNPFPGLRPFEAHERHLFFGRDEQIVELVMRLRRSRFLAVVGSSGSGKSSLVRAGLLPCLHGGTMRGAGTAWHIAVMRPGSAPVRHLAAALADPEAELFAPETDREFLRTNVEVTLERSGLGLVDAVRQARLPKSENVLIVVDQFEELFRFGPQARKSGARDQGAALVTLLLEAARQGELPIYVVLTMRSDFLGDCARYRDLPEAINDGQYLIPRLTREQRRAAIEGPVRVGGAALAPRLLQRLLNDVGDDPDQLPILQHALMRTWDHWAAHRQDGAPLDLPDYEAIGSMSTALSQHADEVFAELPTEGHRRVAEKFFQALTELGPDNRGLRRPTRVADLCAITAATAEEMCGISEAFRRAGRTFLMPPAGVELQPETMLDISHESFMRVWWRLRDWVEAEAQSARLYRRLAETAALWQEGKAGLFRDPDLQIALNWRAQTQPTAAWGERYHPGFAVALKFLDASQAAAVAERAAREAARRRELEQARDLAEAQRRRAEVEAKAARRLRIFSGALAVLVMVAVWSAWNRWRAERRAFSDYLAAGAVSQLTVDPELSLLLARQATSNSWRVLPTASAADVLRQSLFESRARARLETNGGAVRKANFSPDGELVVTVHEKGNAAHVWDAKKGQPVTGLIGHSGPVYAAQFSPDSRRLVTASADGTARLWDARTGKLLRELRGHTQPVETARFSPNGELIVTAGQDNTARVWSVEKPGTVLLQGHTDHVLSAGFNPEGTLVVTASEDGTARVWDALTGQVRQTFAHSQVVHRAEFSADGKSVVTASGDRTARIWSMATGAELHALAGHGDEIRSALFSPSGAQVVTASLDNTARLWTLGLDQTRVLPHPNVVLGAEFSPDGYFVVTACLDNAARVWSVATGQLLATLRGHKLQVNQAAFDSSGERIVTASDDGTARIWEAATGRLVLPLVSVEQIAFSAGAAMVVTTDSTGTATVRDTSQGQSVATLEGEAPVSTLAISLDGTRVALAHGTNAVRLWQIKAEPSVRTLPPLGAVNAVALGAGDGRFLAVACADRSARVWDLDARNELAKLAHPQSVAGAQFSDDGQGLVTWCDDQTVRLWQTRAGQTKAEWPAGAAVQTAAFSHDGRRIVAACFDKIVRVWEIDSPGRVTELRGHTGLVTSLAFSPDDEFVLTGSYTDRSARLWNARTGAGLAVLFPPSDGLLAAVFARDGQAVTSGTADGMVRRYAVPECGPLEVVLELARTRATRPFAPEESLRFLHEAPGK